ncbi:hypothetical protein Tco_1345393 [Tanacetum coccineum]
MTLKDFLHFPGNRSASFSTRPADVPMLVGSPAGSAANVPYEDLEMDVAAPVANNAIGVEVVPPSADVDSKGKRVAFLDSAGSPSFKKRKHLVLDEGPSSLKSVPDIAPSDEAYKTLFRSLASMEDPGDSDPFLPGIEEARSSRDALSAVRFVMSNNLLTHEAQALFAEEKAMLVGRSQAPRDVASSGISVELVDMKDFDPNAEQNYDRAIESFYQAKFPYVDL